MAHVKIRNNKTGGVWLCPERVVDLYLGNGWRKAGKNAAPAVEPVAAAAAEPADKDK